MSRKIRGLNFSEDETLLLLSILESHKTIIENKQTNAVANREKSAAWRKIAEIFNKAMPSSNRLPEQLASKYDNLKTKARSYLANQKQHLYTTGSYSPKTDVILERVLQFIGTGNKPANSDEEPEIIHIMMDDVKEEKTDEMQEHEMYFDVPMPESTSAVQGTTSDVAESINFSKPNSLIKAGDNGLIEAKIKFYAQKSKLLELECQEKELNNRHKQLQILLLEEELSEKKETRFLKLEILKEELEEKKIRNALLTS